MRTGIITVQLIDMWYCSWFRQHSFSLLSSIHHGGTYNGDGDDFCGDGDDDLNAQS